MQLFGYFWVKLGDSQETKARVVKIEAAEAETSRLLVPRDGVKFQKLNSTFH